MEFSKFDQMIQELFDPTSSFDYKSLESWSSMQSLIVVSAIDEHYDVLITYDELKKIDTVEELHSLVVDKLD